MEKKAPDGALKNIQCQALESDKYGKCPRMMRSNWDRSVRYGERHYPAWQIQN